MNYVIIFFLLISMIFDIRNQKIPALWIWCSVVVMAGYRLYLWCNGESTALDVVVSFIPGLLLYLFSCISNGIGKADGLLIIATGCFFSWDKHLEVLLFSFFLAAFFSMGVVIFKRNLRNQRIPFVPFLCAASAISIYL